MSDYVSSTVTATIVNPPRFVDNSLVDPFTEDALALRFSERHAHNLRYVAIRNQWYKWDGVIWAPEKTLEVFDLARNGCREDADSYGNGKTPDRLFTAKTVVAVQQLARADRRQAATIEQFDSDNWLITSADETFDLRTGVGRKPEPADYITKRMACSAAPPGTAHPLWTAFLDRVTANNMELQAFLQRYVGYCLTGDTSEHRFVFAYGTGRNGKGTFINTIAAIFNDYSAVADVGTFIASNHDRHPTDVAKLHGARLVVAQETNKGRQWDEAKIKTMTGGDKMTARFMRRDFFDFTPTFKLFITGNHKPRLDNVDEAMRHRLMLVPFTVCIPLEERDLDLPNKLKAEWPAILRWVLDGCLEWQRIGLAPPAVVTEATKDYFADQDLHQQWLDDCTEDSGPHAFTPVGQLFGSWKQWCDERNMKPGNTNALSEVLVDRGFTRARLSAGRGFRNLVVKQR